MTISAFNPDDGVRVIGEMWVLRKAARLLQCELSTHPLGWELRVALDGEFLRSQVCKSQPELFKVAEHWRAEAVTRGWAE